MKKIIAMVYISSAAAYAGSGVGGGTPPSVEDAGLLLMSSPMLDGILFDKSGDIGMLSRIKLQPEMQATSEGGSMGGGTPPLLLSTENITLLRDKVRRVEAVGAKGGKLSFDVLPGDALDAVVLKDRRLIMRESTSKAD